MARRDFHIAISFLILFSVFLVGSVPAKAQASAQQSVTLSGTVTLGEPGKPIHNALVTSLQLKRTVGTDDNGKYQFQDVPPGRYDVVAHLDRVPDMVKTVDLTT